MKSLHLCSGRLRIAYGLKWGPKTSFTLFQSSIKTRIEIILNSWAKFQLLYTRTREQIGGNIVSKHNY